MGCGGASRSSARYASSPPGASVAASPLLLEPLRTVMSAAACMLAAGVVSTPRRRRAATLRLTQAHQICRFLTGSQLRSRAGGHRFGRRFRMAFGPLSSGHGAHEEGNGLRAAGLCSISRAWPGLVAVLALVYVEPRDLFGRLGILSRCGRTCICGARSRDNGTKRPTEQGTGTGVNTRAFAPFTPHTARPPLARRARTAPAVGFTSRYFSRDDPCGADTHGHRRAGGWRRRYQSSVYGLAKGKRAASGQMRVSERHGKESASEAWPPRAALRILALFALLLGLTLAAAPSADASAGAFIKAYGWGVVDGGASLRPAPPAARPGLEGGGAGQLDQAMASPPIPRATSTSPRRSTTGSTSSPPPARSSRPTAGALSDGASQFETCTTHLPGRGRRRLLVGGAGELADPEGVAIDPSGDVYVADSGYNRIDEFSAAGAFIKAYGWGVSDGASQFETCTTTCRAGIAGGGAGQFDFLRTGGVATDSSGDVYVADSDNNRIDEFSAAGAFIKAYGWGVSDGASQFETCTTTCQPGSRAAAPGSSTDPEGVAIDSSGDVYVADEGNHRIDEFSAAGAFIKAYGWGVAATAPASLRPAPAPARPGSGAAAPGSSPAPRASPSIPRATSTSPMSATSGSMSSPPPARSSGPTAGALSDGASQFETCTSTCQGGNLGGGAGQFNGPRASPPIARATSTSPISTTTGSMSSPPPARLARRLR